MSKRKIIQMLKRIAWGIGLVSFMVVLIAAGRETLKRPLQATPAIVIDYDTDLYFVKEDEVAAIVSQTLPRGLANYQLNEINLAQLEKNIEALPYVKNAEVSTDVNGKLTVSIVQRAPVARVINSFGVSYYLDGGGEKIPVTNNFTTRVPVITGVIEDNGLATGPVESEALKAVLDLVLFVKADPFFEPMIEQVHIDSVMGLTLIPKVDRHTIILGQGDNWPEKMERLRLFYQKGLPSAGWKNYKSIDVRFAHQIVCKR